MSTPNVHPISDVFNGFLEAAQALNDRPALLARVAEAEAARDTAVMERDVVKVQYTNLTDHNDTLRARIAELEDQLNKATFREKDAADRFVFIRDEFKRLMNEATTAISIVEPAPEVKPEAPLPVSAESFTSSESPVVNTSSSTVGGDNQPLSSRVEQLQPSDVKVAGVDNEVTYEKGQSATPFQKPAEPTPFDGSAADVETKSNSATVTNEGQSATPFTAPSTDVPAIPVPPSSTVSPVEPSDTVSSPPSLDELNRTFADMLNYIL